MVRRILGGRVERSEEVSARGFIYCISVLGVTLVMYATCSLLLA